MIVMILSISNIIQSNYIKVWYQKFFLSAVLADVLVLFIVVIFARAIYYYIFDTFSIINFIFVMLALQITHDILFYIMISMIPRGANKMIDVFQDYAKELSYGAIIGDSIMVIAIGLIASYLANFEANTNIIILVVFLYLLQFILYNF
jgi:hypothetical protein